MKRESVYHVVVVLMFFGACKKPENLPLRNGTRLASITVSASTAYPVSFTLFRYDNQNKLSVFVDSFRMLTDNNTIHAHSFLNLISHDSAGRIIRITYREDPIANVSDTMIYNQTGDVVQRIYRDQMGGRTIINRYTYDNQKRLVRDSVYGNGNAEYTVYRYDANNNVIEREVFTTSLGVVSRILKVESTYDSQPNPYKALGMAVYPMATWSSNVNLYNTYTLTLHPFRTKEQVLSANNIITAKYSIGSINHYQYQYFTNGLPKECVIATDSSGVTRSRKVEFNYN